MTDAWFPCYVNDLLGSMRWKMMTPAQRGAYWQLICWQMQSDDGHLDADVRALSLLSDVDAAAPENAILLEAFPMNGTGRRANPRALAEWTRRKTISAVRSKVGSEGIAKRWQGHNKPNSKPIASATTTTTTVTTIPTATATQDTFVGEFADIWKSYPEKSGKPAAFKAYLKARKAGVTPETVKAGVLRYVAYVEHRRKTGFPELRFADGSTWFNAGRWEDECHVPKPGEVIDTRFNKI